MQPNVTPDQNAIPRPRKQQICLIWIVQDTSHISWLGQERLNELRKLGLHLVVPPPTRQHGRSDERAILREQIEDLEDQNDIISVIAIKVDIAVEKFGW